jgi:hypothetical protein
MEKIMEASGFATKLPEGIVQLIDSVSKDKNVSVGNEPILEIPLSELQHILEEIVLTHNQIAELIRDSGILRGKELARLTENHNIALKAERSPIVKLIMLNAYIRQFVTKIHDRLTSMPTPENSKVVQVCTKIMARAIQLIDYIKTYGKDDPRGKRDVALDSQHARLIFSGADGVHVSRRDTIRAMKRAETLWPALKCGHRPNDGHQTMRLTIKRADLGISPEFGYCNTWQRSGKDVSLRI